jgi:hypothetical protein
LCESSKQAQIGAYTLMRDGSNHTAHSEYGTVKLPALPITGTTHKCTV